MEQLYLLGLQPWAEHVTASYWRKVFISRFGSSRDPPDPMFSSCSWFFFLALFCPRLPKHTNNIQYIGVFLFLLSLSRICLTNLWVKINDLYRTSLWAGFVFLSFCFFYGYAVIYGSVGARALSIYDPRVGIDIYADLSPANRLINPKYGLLSNLLTRTYFKLSTLLIS